MKKIKGFVLVMIASAAVLSSCSYAGVATTADGHVVIAQNNSVLFGMLNKVFVCKVTPSGVTNCATAESP